MQLARPACAQHPALFGRRAIRPPSASAIAAVQPRIANDLKLFATTFAAGFLFVSILIG
jgi:hypothetical protein